MTSPRLPINSAIASPGRRGRGAGKPAAHPVSPPVDQGNRLTPPTHDGGPWLLESREVARLLGIGRTKTFQLIASGELPSIRLGRCVRVPTAALFRRLSNQTPTLSWHPGEPTAKDRSIDVPTDLGRGLQVFRTGVASRFTGEAATRFGESSLISSIPSNTAHTRMRTAGHLATSWTSGLLRSRSHACEPGLTQAMKFTSAGTSSPP